MRWKSTQPFDDRRFARRNRTIQPQPYQVNFMDKTIKPIESIRGEIEVPGDKSISHRAVFLGGISRGKTEAHNFLEAEDCLHSVSAFRAMGIEISLKEKTIIINGAGLRGLKKPEKALYLGNSGTTMRILPGILAGQNFEATLTGDESLNKRPMARIVEPLSKMGVSISSRDARGLPPLVVKGGPVKPVEYDTKAASAQVKSCVLFAGLYPAGETVLREACQSRDHTERMLEFFGAQIKKEKLFTKVNGNQELNGRDFFIPGDISSAAFFMVAACMLEGSDITIREVGLNPTRMGLADVLESMGADIQIKRAKKAIEPYGDIRIRFAPLKGTTVEKEKIPLLIDEIPVLAVLAASAEGETCIKGAGELRVKETDRIFSISENLKRLGAEITSRGENLIIKGSGRRFRKSRLESFADHRTAMAMSVAALLADGECTIKNIDCVNTSFPGFFDMLGYLKKV